MNHTTNPQDGDALVSDARRAVHESLTLLPAWEADRVRALIADLETAVEGRTAIRMAVSPSAVVSADRATLRDRIAAALYEHMHPGSYWSDTSMPSDWRPTYLEEADAVLAALADGPSRVAAEEQPAETQEGTTADKAAVLLEIATTLDGLAETDMIRKRRSLGTARRLLAGELRKMAAESSTERPAVTERPDTQTREADRA